MITLDKKVELIVPFFDNDGVEINNQRVDNALDRITEIAGGATVSNVSGQWIGENGEVMNDYNVKYEWYASNTALESILESRHVDIVIIDLLYEHDQEAVSLVVNGTLYIIDDVNDLDYIRKAVL